MAVKWFNSLDTNSRFVSNTFWTKIPKNSHCVMARGSRNSLILLLHSWPWCRGLFPFLLPTQALRLFLKVSKSQKQILKFSFEPKNERKYFCTSALASKKRSNQKHKSRVLYTTNFRILFWLSYTTFLIWHLCIG